MHHTTIQIFEHQKLKIGQYNCFKESHFNSLVKYNEKHRNKYFDVGYKSIIFKEYVGVIQVGGLTIEILPKADKANNEEDGAAKWQSILLNMLRECSKLKTNSISSANLKLKSNSILDLYFEIFIQEVEYLLRSGLVKKYRKTSNNLNVIKGQLNVPKQIAKNLLHKERFYTKYTVYDHKHILHEIIYKTLRVIDKINTSSYLKDRLNRLFMDFHTMPDIKVNQKTFENLKFDRKTSGYKNAINISQLILTNYSPDVVSGGNNLLAILFNMNDLWEEYVFVKLRKYASRNNFKVFGQQSKRFWNYRTLKPDIVIVKDNTKFIIDTKWKSIKNGNDVSTEDLRQIFAYNEFWNAQKGMLLYPNVNEMEDFEDEYKDRRKFCKLGFITIEQDSSLFAERIIDKIL